MERISALLFNRKNLIILVIALVLVVAGFFVSQFFLMEKITSKEFIGSVQKVEGNIVFLKGLYVVPKKPEIMKKEGLDQEVQVVVDGKTEIAKTLMHMPTVKDLAKTNGRWDPDKLQKEEVGGVISDLTDKKQGLIIKVLTDNDIFKKTKFIAKRIEFTEPVYSD